MAELLCFRRMVGWMPRGGERGGGGGGRVSWGSMAGAVGPHKSGLQSPRTYGMAGVSREAFPENFCCVQYCTCVHVTYALYPHYAPFPNGRVSNFRLTLWRRRRSPWCSTCSWGSCQGAGRSPAPRSSGWPPPWRCQGSTILSLPAITQMAHGKAVIVNDNVPSRTSSLVSTVLSSSGSGLSTASTTQLAMMVRSTVYSKGGHSIKNFVALIDENIST